MSEHAALARETARILLDTQSVLFNADEPFIFTSGRKSPVYVDCRRLISFPAGRAKLMEMACALLRENGCIEKIDLIAGGETAGIPYAAFLSDRLGKPMVYVRKKPKGFGRMAQIEGHMERDGLNVLLVEDLQTDGGSKRVFIDALRGAGAVVEHAFVLFHYGIYPASAENMKALGIELHALATWRDVLALAREEARFPPATLEAVEAFLNAPEDWRPSGASESHAG